MITTISMILAILGLKVAAGYRVDELLGQSLAALCDELPLLKCDYFRPSTDASLRSRWVESGVYSETRSTFFRCCHLRHTGGKLDLGFLPDSPLPRLIPVSGDSDEYVIKLAKNFQGVYLDIGSGSEAAICQNAPFQGMGVSVEPVEFLAERISEACPHVRTLVGNMNGESTFYEINNQVLEALYEEQSAIPQWILEASTALPIFRVMKENAITREVGTFIEDLFYERTSQMTTIQSILELAGLTGRSLLLRLRAGGLEPVIMDEVLRINPEVSILSHEYMELVDLANIVQSMPGEGACALSLKYLFCLKDLRLFESVFSDKRALLRTLDI